MAAIKRAVFDVDYELIWRRTRRLARLIEAGRDGLIISGAGCRLAFTLDRAGRVSIGDGFGRRPGGYATLPNGKVKLPVIRRSFTGALVVNGVIIPPLNEVSEPVTLRFDRGQVTDIGGGSAVRWLGACKPISNWPPADAE